MIPIFIITCDRLEMLKKCVKSMDKIETPHEVVFVDFNTTYEPTLDYLKSTGYKVHWERKIKDADQLNLVAGPVEEYFKTHPVSKYVVTDGDIELNCKGDILDKYAMLLDRTITWEIGHEKIDVVGPMLEISDIPDYYPLKESVIREHWGQFWRYKPKDHWGVGAFRCQLDTTFGMYRENKRFERLQMGFRTFAPYTAKHLPWYVKPGEATEDEIYYKEHNQNSILHY